jgi:hypothetical protein
LKPRAPAGVSNKYIRNERIGGADAAGISLSSRVSLMQEDDALAQFGNWSTGNRQEL